MQRSYLSATLASTPYKVVEDGKIKSKPQQTRHKLLGIKTIDSKPPKEIMVFFLMFVVVSSVPGSLLVSFGSFRSGHRFKN